jgi:hypothetical protein
MNAGTFSSYALLLAALGLGGCASVGANRPPQLTVQEVIQLSRDRVPAEEIIRRMNESGAVYRLPASELAKLHGQGVPDRVIDYMNQTHIEAARRDEALYQRDRYLWYGWPSYRAYPYGYRGYYGPYWWYGPPWY